MKTDLHIGKIIGGKDFYLPLKAVTETFGVLAKRGVGKTHTGMVMTEEMLARGQQVVVVDPVGVWWGLKSSADGKSPGFSIVVFGGEHGDIPLDEHAGEIVAQSIIEHGFSAILDLSLFKPAEQHRFMLAFAEALYRLNRKPLHLMVDEADEFAPQRPLHGMERLLGAFENIVRRGRARGLGVTLITQRAAVLNKNVLTQIEVLVVLRNISPQDREAIETWTKVHGTKDQLDQLAKEMASLDIGEAWFWSPGWLGIFEKVKVREKKTFDSSATPKIGEVAKRPKVLAEINLDQLGAQIKATAESAKANNPAELKKQLAAAKQEIAKLHSAKPGKVAAPKATVIKLPLLIPEVRLKSFEAQLVKLEPLQERFRELIETGKALQRMVVVAQAEMERVANIPMTFPGASAVRPVAPAPTPRVHVVPRPAVVSGVVSNGEMDETKQQILDTLKMFRVRGLIPDKEMLARWHLKSNREGLHPTGGRFGTNLAWLRAEGYLDGCELTEKGFAAAQDIPSGFDAALRTVTGTQERILLVLQDGAKLTKETLAEALGLHPTGGRFGTDLGRLRTMGLIPSRGAIELTEAAKL